MCGIVGIVDSEADVSYKLFYALCNLQHRGQESAGIVTFDGKKIYKHMGQGLVNQIFSLKIIRFLEGNVGIGHVQYPRIINPLPDLTNTKVEMDIADNRQKIKEEERITKWKDDETSIQNDFQPLSFMFQNHSISIASTGKLINARDLMKEVENLGFSTNQDNEIISKIFTSEINKSRSINDAVRSCMKKLQGSYTVVIMIDGIVYAFRDPLGVKPLCLGKLKSGYIVASESVAIDILKGKFIRDVRPGELIRIDINDFQSWKIASADHHAHCLFELLYFSRADSIIDGISVYEMRRTIGKILYDTESESILNKTDYICAVPDGGRGYANGFAECAKIPFFEGIMSNKYVDKIFVTPKMRTQTKYNVMSRNLREKTIILIEDSIVRGTILRGIIDKMRNAGIKKIHLRIGAPKIIASCYLDIDQVPRDELFASSDNIEIQEQLAATTFRFITLDDMIKAICIMGKDPYDFCMGCITNVYPLPIRDEPFKCNKIDLVDTTKQCYLSDY